MKSRNWVRTTGFLVALALSLGCDSGGGGGGGNKNIGDNIPGVYVAIGDSITQGTDVPAGPPYPSRLAAMSGKTIINAGRGGELSSGGAGRVSGLLSKHTPACLLILYGANDIIKGKSDESILANLNAIIQAAKANQTIPVIASLLPQYDSHGIFDGRVQALNPKIANLAKSTRARFVNLGKEFAGKRDLVQPDGLHPSDRGTTVIAAAFGDKI